MNFNIEQKKVQIFRKLVKKNKSIINKIREIYLETELEDFDPMEYIDEIELIIKARVKKMSDKDLIEYWEDSTDVDFSIVPKKELKNLTEKEREFIDEN